MKTQLVGMIEQVLADPTNLELVSSLVAPDVTYVSLNFDNPELKRVMPWAGTARGPQAIVDTYSQVGQYWKNKGLTISDRLESENSAAVFGSFTYESHTLGKTITSPFCILIRVTDGKIMYVQFMEDTFGTASTFRAAGSWLFRSNPKGAPVEIKRRSIQKCTTQIRGRAHREEFSIRTAGGHTATAIASPAGLLPSGRCMY